MEHPERPSAAGEPAPIATAAAPSPAVPAGGRHLDRGFVVLLAVATGIAVASNYYVQPLLADIRDTFHVSSGAAGLVVTASQVGYVLGLMLLLPLGDLLERRRLVVVMSLVTAVCFVGAGLAPGIGLLYAVVAVIGLSSVVAQILVSFAASLAPDDERGRVVGTVMSGLLIGILLARTVSGYLGALVGWRGVYFVAAGVVLVLAAVLWRALPAYREPLRLTYGGVLRSVVHIFASQPVLRLRSLYGALSFGAFSVLWTSLAFLLSASPYHYGSGVIGLFGLVGVAGAVMASVAGRLGDRGDKVALTFATSAAMTVAFVMLWVGSGELAVVIAAIFILDVGCQGLHVTNQSEIFRLLPGARSRVNSGYMTCYFTGGVLGSVGSALSYEQFGWQGVCALGVAFGGGALLVACVEQVVLAVRRPAVA